jgi:NAD(P)-dependent dehydrogenase (short-subunit alcohol dehydrogenase family)
MENTKTAFVTGATGGIGEAVVRRFVSLGYRVIAPVRKLEEAKSKYEGMPVDLFLCADLGDQGLVNELFTTLKIQNVSLDVVALTAGAFAWDNDKRKGDKMKSVEQVAKDLYHANVATKDTIVTALVDFYKESLSSIDLVVVSSQAATFSENDPKRLNEKTGFKEEGYIHSMQIVSGTAKSLKQRNIFKSVFLYEPGLIDTPLAREAFSLETIGEELDWEVIMKPDEAATTMLTEAGLI